VGIDYFDLVFVLFLCGTFFFQRLQPPMILLMFVGLYFKRASVITIRQRLHWKSPLVWLVVFFFVHILGLVNSEHVMEGWTDVSMKLSLLVFPLFFLLAEQQDTSKIMNVYARLGSLSVLICVIVAAYKVVLLGHNPLKNESEFTIFMHRSYQAIYWCIGVFWCLYCLLEKKGSNWLNGIQLFLLVFGTFLTFSKAGIIATMLGFLLVFILLIVKYKRYKMAGLAVLMTALLLMSVNFVTGKPLARFKVMAAQMFDSSKAKENTKDSNSARLMMWKTSMDVIAENPILGVGTGDMKSVLNEENIKRGLPEYAKDNLNSHNQFLNTGVALGWIGMIVLGMVFITAFLQNGIEGKRAWVLPTIVGIIVVFLLTESGLERQAGVVLFTFLMCLFAVSEKREVENARH